jgi:vacuolar-type H+-ATPase subunit I/STV1
MGICSFFFLPKGRKFRYKTQSMRRLFYILLPIGVIAALLSVLYREMHWPGGRELRIVSIIILIIAMIIFLISFMRNKSSIPEK